jgi:hypothetical protein
MTDESPSKQIDAIIRNSSDWRGEMLATLRAVILDTDSEINEAVKWKKPSKPEGVSVWELGGILCVGEMLKSAVRLTFPKGALVNDPKKIFNTRLDSKSVRAVDFHEGEAVDAVALKALIREAIGLNTSKNR